MSSPDRKSGFFFLQEMAPYTGLECPLKLEGSRETTILENSCTNVEIPLKVMLVQKSTF